MNRQPDDPGVFAVDCAPPRSCVAEALLLWLVASGFVVGLVALLALGYVFFGSELGPLIAEALRG